MVFLSQQTIFSPADYTSIVRQSLSDANLSVGVRQLFQIAASPTFPIRFF